MAGIQVLGRRLAGHSCAWESPLGQDHSSSRALDVRGVWEAELCRLVDMRTRQEGRNGR